MASRKTIAQRISLDGGAEIEAEFKKLGKAGEEAFAQIKRHIEGTRTPFQQFQKGIADVRRDLAPVGRAFSDLGRSVQSFARNLALIGGAIAGAGAGLIAITKNATSAADEIGKAATGAGIGAEAFQRLGFAAEQSGLSQSDFVAGLTRLNQQISRAAEGNEAAASRFRELGVSIRDASGNLRPTEAILRDLADAFRRLPNDARAAGIGSEFFGRSIAKWLPLLREGGDVIEALGDQFEASVGGFSEAQIALATETNDAWAAMGKALTNVRHQVGLAFAPSLLRGIRAFHETITSNRDAIVAFARDIASRVAPVVADLFATLSGRDAEVVNQSFVEWRDSVTQFGRDVRSVVEGAVIPLFRGIVTAADGVARALRTITLGFADFTGGQLLIGGALLALTGGFRVLRDAIMVAYAALVLFGKHPIILGATVAGAGLAFLFNLIRAQNDGAAAADAHREALNEMDRAIAAVRAGVPGAEKVVEDLAEKHLAAAEAAEAHARSAVDYFRIQKEIEAATVSPVFGVPQDTLELFDLFTERLDAAAQRTADVRAKMQEGRDAAKQYGAEVGEIGKTAKDTGDIAADAGEKIKRAFPGPAAHIRHNPFNTTTEGAREAGDEAERSGQKVETSADRMAQHIRVVPDEWRQAGTAAQEAGATTTAAMDDAAAGADALAASLAEVPDALAHAGAGASVALQPATAAFVGIEEQATQTATALPNLFQTAADAIAAAFTDAFARIKTELASLTAAVTAAIARMTAETGPTAGSPGVGAVCRRPGPAAAVAAVRASPSAVGCVALADRVATRSPLGYQTPSSCSLPTRFRTIGVDFMEMVRRKLLPRNVLDILRGAMRGFKDGGLVQPVRFNFGGLADAHALPRRPASAAHGAALALAGISQTNPFEGMTRVDSLHIPGFGETPAFLPTNVVGELQATAQSQKRRSGGKVY
jgi:hypothetical protein